MIQAQKIVRGTVVNAKTNSPIELATVSVKGSSVAVTTSDNGVFTITIPIGNNILVIYSVGFVEQQLSVIGSVSNYNILLQENSSSLNEVVVTALGIKRIKKHWVTQ